MKKLLLLLIIPFLSFGQADIVGGDDANIQDYPYMAALIGGGWGGGYAFCGASIINEYWILTAAHCMSGQSANNTSVRVGTSTSYAQGGDTYDVAQIITHENYSSTTNGNDIALLRLENPIEFSNTVSPVLVICDQQVQLGVQDPGEMSWITGWGEDEGTANNPNQLQVVGVPITTQSNYGGISSDMIMAGYSSGGYDSCQGDSGGPMVVLADDGQTYMQVGVVSWGSGCAEPNYPGVYARVSYFIDWICDNTNGDVCANQNEFCDSNAVGGCTDATALNYNSNATYDNGSCEYACDNNVQLSLQLDCYGEEISWNITNDSGATVQSVNSGTYPGGSTADTMEEGGSLQEQEICLSAGCYNFTITDSYGDGLAGSQWTCEVDGTPFSLTDQDGVLLFEETSPTFGDCESLGDESLYDDTPCSQTYSFCVSIGEPVYGCTDSNANNYNPDANTNDGTCEYLGCTDINYVEYDANANVDDGSCITVIVEGCTDPLAENYNPDANTNNDSCEYIEGCTDSNATNYNPDAVVDDGSCDYPYSWTACNNQIWFEGFENYNISDILPQTGEWLLWDGTTSSADINSPGFYDSNQSIVIDEQDDIVHEFLGAGGYLNSGSGELRFYVNIPSENNSGGYFNLLHNYNDADSNWAYEVFFASNSSGTASYVAADVNVEFNIVYDKWVEVRNVIDIDNDIVELYYDGNLIHSWTWSDGSTESSSVLGAFNLYAGCAGTNCVSNAWFDNIELCGDFNNNSDIADNQIIKCSIYPNPNNGSFELLLNHSVNNLVIEMIDITGKVLYSEVIENYNLNSKHNINTNLDPGSYILNIISNEYNSQKMIVVD